MLEGGQARIDQAFNDVPITELVHGRARLVDRVLIAAWSLFALDRFPQAALVAVGGYGFLYTSPCPRFPTWFSSAASS